MALGMDVPFFLGAGRALATGRGERCRRCRRTALALVLVNPRFPLATRRCTVGSTPALYADGGRRATGGRRRSGAQRRTRWRRPSDERARAAPRPACPADRQIKAALLGAGALGALMSGSGPTVFGIARVRWSRRGRSGTRVSAGRGALGGPDAARGGDPMRRPAGPADPAEVDLDELGRGQAVRRGTLDPVFGGSNPPAPTTSAGGSGEGGAMPYELKLFSGNANRPLAEEIAQYLRVPLGDARGLALLRRRGLRPDQRERARRGRLRRPAHLPAGERNLMELLVMLDALQARVRRAAITAVLPYYGYAPPGPQGAAARADLGQAGGRPDHRRGRRAACSRSTCTPGRSRASSTSRWTTSSPRPVMIDYLGEEGPAGPGRRLARRRRRGARAGHRQAAQRAAWPSSTSAATAPTSPCSCTSSATSRTRTSSSSTT